MIQAPATNYSIRRNAPLGASALATHLSMLADMREEAIAAIL